MKRTLMLFTLFATFVGMTLPTTAQTQNSVSLIKVYGRVAQVSNNQFVLNSNVGQLTVSNREAINLGLNEPITVTGTLGPSTLNAYSITRSDGTNITFSPTGTSVQRIVDSLN